MYAPARFSVGCFVTGRYISITKITKYLWVLLNGTTVLSMQLSTSLLMISLVIAKDTVLMSDFPTS